MNTKHNSIVLSVVEILNRYSASKNVTSVSKGVKTEIQFEFNSIAMSLFLSGDCKTTKYRIRKIIDDKIVYESFNNDEVNFIENLQMLVKHGIRQRVVKAGLNKTEISSRFLEATDRITHYLEGFYDIEDSRLADTDLYEIDLKIDEFEMTIYMQERESKISVHAEVDKDGKLIDTPDSIKDLLIELRKVIGVDDKEAEKLQFFLRDAMMALTDFQEHRTPAAIPDEIYAEIRAMIIRLDEIKLMLGYEPWHSLPYLNYDEEDELEEASIQD